MRKLMLLAGVAALSASLPVIAKENPRGGNGNGSQASQGGGHGNGQRAEGRGRGGRNHAERGNSGERESRSGRQDRGHQSARRGGEERGRDRHVERRQDSRADQNGRGREARVERRVDRDERRAQRALRDDRRIVREARDERRERNDIRQARQAQSPDRNSWSGQRLIAANRYRDDTFSWREGRGRALAVRSVGCPPGLAKQNAYCMPPGQLRKARLIGQRLPLANLGYNVPDRYSYRFADSDDSFYRYDDEGYVYRFDRGSGLVNNITPLFGSDLFVGQPMPLGYDAYNVPMAYRSYYPDGGDYRYRYDDSAIYQVNPETNLVEGIVALLTGGVGGLGGLGIGDALPSGYDAYNVPMDYRDEYADSNEAMYRYADGSVYEVDPQTRLIEQVISLLG